MAKKPSITTISTGYYSRQALNNNFENLQLAFDNFLSLDGSSPNAMQSSLDMNGNPIINASAILVGGSDLLALTQASLSAAQAAQAAAQTAETNAEASEAAAATSATNAASSATSASTSATSASASETAAATSATNAAASETAAGVSETNAAASAAAASTSATNAATSATNAASSATAAAGSASTATAASDAALAALDSFDDRYLGQKESDPTLDNDGNALVAGALYFNTTDEIMKVYDGSLWVAAYASLSGAMFGSNNLSDVASVSASRTNLGLGTAATTDATDYATAVHSHVKADITDFSDADYATASQGALADTAIQPADLATVATTGAYSDLTGTPAPYADADVDTHLNTGTATTDQVLSWDGLDYAWADAPNPFAYNAVSGATQALDVGTYNFFDAGTLTADTTVSFSSVPTEARWTYTAEIGFAAGSSYGVALPSLLNTFDISSETTGAEDLFFKSDGTKVYVMSFSTVYQYSLSTAWDLSTASYDSKSFDAGTQEALPTGIFFKSDGTKMYITGYLNDRVYQYSLSTAWDVSTASYDSVSFSVSSQELTPFGLSFKSDGTRMYIIGQNADAVLQYNLSTAWNLATASYSGVSFSTAAQSGSMQGLFFSEDGLNLFGVGSVYVFKYTLSTAWDLTTASYVEQGSVGITAKGVFFSSSGEKLFITSASSLREFSAQSLVSITLPASVQNPPTEAVGFNDQASYTFFTADGGTTVTLIGEEIT